MLGFRSADQPQIGFMDESGGLQGLTRLLVRQVKGRELPQLLVHKRQELIGG